MKIKSMLSVLCFGLCSVAMAEGVSVHSTSASSTEKSVAARANYPGYCEIEVINDSYNDTQVIVDTGDAAPISFYLYRAQAKYVDLFYNGYCHNGAYLTIQTPYQVLYSAWTTVGSSVRIVPYLNKEAKVQVTNR